MSGVVRRRYGAVGCGRVFERYHLPGVQARPALELVAVCDADEERARTVVAGVDGVLVTADLQRFLEQGRPDVVSVCTPNDAHATAVLAALDAGASVLCEKPLAESLESARRLVAAAGERRAGINLPYRFHDLLPALRDAVADTDCEVRLRFTTMGHRLWRPVSPWYGSAARAGGGALIDLGIHAIDLLLTVFGPATMRACTVDAPGIEERAVLDLEFARGPARLEIDRAGRTLELCVDVCSPRGTVSLDLRRNELRTPAGTYSGSGARIELAAIESFLDAVTGGEGTIVPLADALPSQELVETAYAAAAAAG